MIHRYATYENRKKIVVTIIFIDIFLSILSYFSSYLVRFDLEIPEIYFNSIFYISPVWVLIKIACLYSFSLYKSENINFTSVADLLNVIKACSLSTLLLTIFCLLYSVKPAIPRSIFFIDWCFSILLLSGIRCGLRLFYERRNKLEEINITRKISRPGKKNDALVILMFKSEIIKLYIFSIFLIVIFLLYYLGSKFQYLIFKIEIPLLLLIILLALFGRHLLLWYRIQRGFYGENRYEAFEIIGYINRKSKDIDFTDSEGKKRVFPEIETEEQLNKILGDKAFA